MKTESLEAAAKALGVDLTTAADHVVLSRGGARVLGVGADFLDRPAAERDALRGDPPAPLVLVGPTDLATADLVALGVEAREPVDAATLDLLLTRVERQDRARFEVRHVLDIASSLNAERDPDRLLGRILESMRHLTGADAGTLFVIDDTSGIPCLRFRVAQNDSVPIGDISSGVLALDRSSIAGYVVLERRAVNLPDVRQLGSAPFRFNEGFDARAGYRTVSMLAVPLVAADGDVLGAVQLINRKRVPSERLGNPARIPERVTPFSARDETLALSMAGAASIALVNARLAAEIEHLFDGFVRSAVMAIEARDPTTSGHSLRVSQYALGLAHAALDDGRFRHEVPFDKDRLRRLEYAALLHDFGKIGVREEVLVKARKLYPTELDALRHRFEVAGLAHEVVELRRAIDGGADRETIEGSISRRHRELTTFLQRLMEANEPGPTPGDVRAVVEALAGGAWIDREGRPRPYLTQREHECLSIRYGSLTEEERNAIQDHAAHTMRFLEQIPWGRALAGLPRVAALHHEKLDGSGYPHGYSGDQIPLESRIITVVDIFDALTASDRPYKSAIPYDGACDILRGEADRGRLDPRLVEIFVERNVQRAVSAVV